MPGTPAQELEGRYVPETDYDLSVPADEFDSL